MKQQIDQFVPTFFGIFRYFARIFDKTFGGAFPLHVAPAPTPLIFRPSMCLWKSSTFGANLH